jgi:hypothetical protein
MNATMEQTECLVRDDNTPPIDLEFEHYLVEVYFNDYLDARIQQMMEVSREQEAVIQIPQP